MLLQRAALWAATKLINFPANTKGVPIIDYRDATWTHSPRCSEYVAAPLLLAFHLISLPLSVNSSRHIKWNSQAQLFIIWRVTSVSAAGLINWSWPPRSFQDIVLIMKAWKSLCFAHYHYFSCLSCVTVMSVSCVCLCNCVLLFICLISPLHSHDSPSALLL